MVINLNPAISSNRASIAFGSSQSSKKGLFSRPTITTMSGREVKQASWGVRTAAKVMLGLGSIGTLITGCKKESVNPDPKPPVQTELAPVEKAIMTMAKDDMGVDPNETKMLDSIATKEVFDQDAHVADLKKSIKFSKVQPGDTLIGNVEEEYQGSKMKHTDKFYLDKDGVLVSKSGNYTLDGQPYASKLLITRYVKKAKSTNVSNNLGTIVYEATSNGVNQSLRKYSHGLYDISTVVNSTVTKLFSSFRKAM